MPKGFTEAEKRTISKRLLEQGAKQFALYGLKKTTVEELAKAAGISKGAFYLFHESKEALFMDVVEQAELRYRQEVLAMVDQPGPTAQARLFAVLYTAFTLWKNTPILQLVTREEYEWLSRRVPAQKIQEHLQSDRGFTETLVARCQAAGIPITAPSEQIDGLLHAIFFSSLHEDDLGPDQVPAANRLLLRLVAAYCLGDVTLESVVDAGKEL